MSLLFKVLAVTGSAMFAGIMLAIGVILGGYWKSLPPADFLEWFAKHSQLVMRAMSERAANVDHYPKRIPKGIERKEI